MTTLNRMEELLSQMEARADGRASFLRCYALMTKNMISAVADGAFEDPVWMRRFIDHFAEYYFIGLDQYENDATHAPKVWVLAHDTANRDSFSSLQKVLLGVNAHINFDLALTLADLLEHERAEKEERRWAERYSDYCLVNRIIGETIDSVQDQILEPGSPTMKLLDVSMGRLDEWLISRLIRSWRDEVWDRACEMMDAPGRDGRFGVVSRLEENAMDRGERIRSLKGLFN